MTKEVHTTRELLDLFSKLEPREKDAILDWIRSLLSERQ